MSEQLTEREIQLAKIAAREAVREVTTDNSNVWVRRKVAAEIIGEGRRVLERLINDAVVKYRQGESANSAIEYNMQDLIDYKRSKASGLSKHIIK